MNPAAAQRIGGAPAARLASSVIALLVGLVLLSGSLLLETEWSSDVAAWLVLAVTFTAVGTAVTSRVPANPFGWVLLAIAATSAVTVSTASSDAPAVLTWLRSWMVYVPVGLVPIALLLFPTGRLPSARWRGPLALAVLGVAVPAFFLAVASAIEPDPLGLFGAPAGPAVDGLLVAVRIGGLAAGLALLLAVLSLFVRQRRASDVEHRQILCLLLGAIVLALGLALEFGGLSGAWIVGAAALPVAAGVAILWHRLYDLDLFLNRSLVYIGLTGTLVGAFAAIILLGDLVAGHLLPDGSWTLIAVSLVALALDPLRRRLQRSVDRLLYGSRDDPYAVVTALGRGLACTTDGPAMLSEVAEAVAGSLSLPYAAIEVLSPDATTHTTHWGRCHGSPIGLPLAYHGELIGRLMVTPRTVGGRLSERDRRLLEDLAHPVALTIKAVELSAGLQRAREQLVTTREEERRRLRRDLHDGIGPTLAGMVMQLDATSNVLRRDPGAVEPLLGGLRTAARDAIDDIRRLVDELRPPALDELGLIGAIREWTDRFRCDDSSALALSIDAPPHLPSLPAAVEVAALRIVQEAVANVVRHAQARTCSVRIVDDGVLALEIEDDGCGIARGCRPGVGLGSMRERAAEVGGSCTIINALGGGTRVRAILPLACP